MAGHSRLDFDAEPFLKLLNAELQRRLKRCAILIWSHWKSLLNVEGTGLNSKGNLVYGANPSKPGEPPRKQTGRLLASAAWELVGLVARIGTNLDYGRILEMGGFRVKKRPSLKRAADEKAAECEQILARPINGG